MQRDLDAMAGRKFDLAVIGGGVIGSAVARDAARRGMHVALLERDDFACAASEAMSHLIHGGIRYLAQGHFSQIAQSLRERRIWRRVAPDFVKPQPFMVPLFNKSVASRLALSLGTRLFELAGGNGFGHHLSRSKAIAAEPLLDLPGLAGACLYSDCRIDQPERLVLAMLADACANGAQIANHAEVEAMAVDTKHLRLVVREAIGSETFTLLADKVANVTGPWAQKLATQLLPGQAGARLTASKGIHIVTRQLNRSYALALSGKGEHAFIVPWGGFSLIGTTDTADTGDPGSAVATNAEVHELTAKVLRLLPLAKQGLEAPVSAFAGVRALPGASGDTYSASRDFQIVCHANDGAPSFFSIYGGKWTTARLVAEKAVDRIAQGFQRPLKACDTATANIALLPASAGIAGTGKAFAGEMALTDGDRLRRMSRLEVLRGVGKTAAKP